MQNGVSDGDAIGIPVGIGEGSHIRKTIVDKNARIGKNVMVCSKIDQYFMIKLNTKKLMQMFCADYKQG